MQIRSLVAAIALFAAPAWSQYAICPPAGGIAPTPTPSGATTPTPVFTPRPTGPTPVPVGGNTPPNQGGGATPGSGATPTIPPTGTATPRGAAGGATPSGSGAAGSGVSGAPAGGATPSGSGASGVGGATPSPSTQTPSARPAGTSPSAGAPGPGGARPAGAATPGSAGAPGARKKNARSYEGSVNWTWWWAYNGSEFQNPRIVRDTVTMLGAGEIVPENELDPEAAQREANKARILAVPHLLVGAGDADARVRAESILALGKCGDETVVDVLIGALADKAATVRESACLALGLLGHGAGRMALVEIVRDTRTASRFVGREKSVDEELRAFAAVSLGLLAERQPANAEAIVAVLAETAEEHRADADLTAAFTTALGLTRSPLAAPCVARILRSHKNDLVRAQAATALGRIGDRSAVGAVLAAASDDSTHVRRSAVIALGRVAGPDDAAAIELLRRTARDGADVAERNFAIMSLGRIGGAANRDFLGTLLLVDDDLMKTHAALALGLALKSDPAADREPIGAALLSGFRTAKSCTTKGAFAIGMGLAGYGACAPELREVVAGKAHGHLRGECAQALGLLRDREGAAVLRAAIEDQNEPEVRLGAARALGLIGDKSAIGILNKAMLDGGGNVAIGGSVLRSIGLIGDGSVIDGLGMSLRNTTEKSDVIRGYAANALGVVADREDLSPLLDLGRDENYVSQSGALSAILVKIY